ncbi:unnamed protein product [Nippostrongylus brasiliensis]|uniref:Protein FAM13A n=1 Tax=Nippostrongylus brasiliensis TaxID=27835 RepID=A0A0N4XTS5_NIPBR|nr:unnamed protein product [Nippostrongylus brasiliensis]
MSNRKKSKGDKNSPQLTELGSAHKRISSPRHQHRVHPRRMESAEISSHLMSPPPDEETMRVLRPLDGGVVYHRQKMAAAVDTQCQTFLQVSRMRKRVKFYIHSY